MSQSDFGGKNVWVGGIFAILLLFAALAFRLGAEESVGPFPKEISAWTDELNEVLRAMVVDMITAHIGHNERGLPAYPKEDLMRGAGATARLCRTVSVRQESKFR